MLLILADLAFIAVHVVSNTMSLEFLSGDLFSIARDHGYAEFFQYVKEFWIILLTLSVFSKTREMGYIAWAIVWAYLLLDDSLRIHENLGAIMAYKLNLVPTLGLRAQDLGELVVTATSLTFLSILIGIYYSQGSSMFRKISGDFLLLLATIAFFGVFVDMADIAIKLGSTVKSLLVVVEDGGEMMAISMLAWYIFLLNSRNGHASYTLLALFSRA